MKMAAESALIQYDGPIETPLEYEGLARLIGDPLVFDYDALPKASLDRAKKAWAGFDLPRRREFAAWFGLWSARERFRRQ